MADYGSLSFEEQLAFFRAKLNLPTERWDDLMRSAHDRAFVVAGAMQADLLADLREAVTKGIEQGTTLEEFRRDFRKIVEKHGWTGWTGEGTAAGEAWRTRVIYETNLRSSHAAGRYQQMQAIKHRRPWWRYRHNDSVITPRPEHLALDGNIIHADDPFWQTHFPPNGWGCRCYVETLADRDLEREGIDPASLKAPEVIIDPKTGDPVGIDKGWGYAPGRTWWPNLDKYPFDTARAMVSDYAADGVMQRWFDRVAEQVAALMAQPVSAGLGGDALVRAWRQAGLIPDERLPMAVISPEVRARLGTERQVVMLSADTLIKQMVKRQGQGHAASWYEKLQPMLDGARVVTQDGENKAIYWRQADKLWMAVVKTTAARDEVYLVSLHEVNAAYAKARIPRDQWEMIGVA